jgi:hypothetical protein
MMISISNTGKTISVYVSEDILNRMNERILRADLGDTPHRYGMSFNNGFVSFGRPGSPGTRVNRRFSKSATGGGYYFTATSNEISELPVFASETWPDLLYGRGQGGVPLPPAHKLRAPELRLTRTDRAAPVVETAPQPETRTHIGAKNGFAGWNSEESRQRSMAGLVKAREVRSAKRKAREEMAARRATSHHASDRVVPTIEPRPRAAKQPTVPVVSFEDGSANVVVAIGSKTVTFALPPEALLDLAFDLSESGYRVKESV